MPSTDGIVGKGAAATRDAYHTLIATQIAKELAIFYWNDQWYIDTLLIGGNGNGWQALGASEVGEHRASEWINYLAANITEEEMGFEPHTIGESYMPRVKRMIRNKLAQYACFQPHILNDADHAKSFNIRSGKVINGVVFKDEIFILNRYETDISQRITRRKQNRSEFFQSPLPYALPERYELNSTPMFDEFLARCFQVDGSRNTQAEMLIRQWLGCNLLNQYTEQKMLFVRGEGGTSKGTLLRLITALLGNYVVNLTNMADLAQQFALQSVIGKLGIIIGDMTKRPTRLVDHYDTGVQIAKSIVGGDPQSVDRKFKSRLPEVQIVAMVTAAGNSLPHFVRDDSEAEAWGRRMLIVKMDNKLMPSERIVDFDKKILALDGIGNIAFSCIVEYVRAIASNGNTVWAMPEESATQLRNFMQTENSVGEFVEQCLEFGEGDGFQMPQPDLVVAMVGHPNWYNEWRQRALASLRKSADYRDALAHILMQNGVKISGKKRYTNRMNQVVGAPFLQGVRLSDYGEQRIRAGLKATTKKSDWEE